MTDFIKELAHLIRNAKREYVLIAVDGRCGAGKTTFAERIATDLDASVIHMDHFFLPKYKRTPERLAQAGGNFDRERFLGEVLIPLRKTGMCRYRPYNCSIGTIDGEINVPRSRVYIIEGSYSCHPEIWGYYDLRVFLTVDTAEQMRRIISREGEEKWEMFYERWIPMEERYFDTFGIADRCDLVFDTSDQGE